VLSAFPKGRDGPRTVPIGNDVLVLAEAGEGATDEDRASPDVVLCGVGGTSDHLSLKALSGSQ
jgi:hypothetical protein